jgi:hypothetical protein
MCPAVPMMNGMSWLANDYPAKSRSTTVTSVE